MQNLNNKRRTTKQLLAVFVNTYMYIVPELFTRDSCRKDWKRISAESSLMSPLQSVKGLKRAVYRELLVTVQGCGHSVRFICFKFTDNSKTSMEKNKKQKTNKETATTIKASNSGIQKKKKIFFFKRFDFKTANT